jgi:hypothetical protein
VFPKTLALRVGLMGKDRISKTKNRAQIDLFYGRILEYGRKAQTVLVKRRTKKGGRVAYHLRVKPISRNRYDFVAGRAMSFATSKIRPTLKTIWERALFRASSGGGDE